MIVMLSLCIPELSLIFLPSLMWDASWIKLALVGDDDFATLLSGNHTRIAPREIIHMPEGVKWKGKREHRYGEDVENHPPNHFPLPASDKDDSLQTVDSSQENKSRQGNDSGF